MFGFNITKQLWDKAKKSMRFVFKPFGSWSRKFFNFLFFLLFIAASNIAYSQFELVDESRLIRHNKPASSPDFAQALFVDLSGNVYVTGYSYTSETDYDYATIKYDSKGNQIWVARYNGISNKND